MKTILLGVGDIVVSREPVILKTILGSCVAVCLWDKKLRSGGLNHCLLPQDPGASEKPSNYCFSSVDMLVETMIKQGSNKSNLCAKVFGGGKVMSVLSRSFNIGEENVSMAKKKLSGHGIPVISEFTLDNQGLGLLFYTNTGKVFIRSLGTE